MSYKEDQLTTDMIHYWEERIATLQKYPTQYTDDGKKLDPSTTKSICDWRIRLAQGHLKKWKKIELDV